MYKTEKIIYERRPNYNFLNRDYVVVLYICCWNRNVHQNISKALVYITTIICYLLLIYIYIYIYIYKHII